MTAWVTLGGSVGLQIVMNLSGRLPLEIVASDFVHQKRVIRAVRRLGALGVAGACNETRWTSPALIGPLGYLEKSKKIYQDYTSRSSDMDRICEILE